MLLEAWRSAEAQADSGSEDARAAAVQAVEKRMPKRIKRKVLCRLLLIGILSWSAFPSVLALAAVPQYPGQQPPAHFLLLKSCMCSGTQRCLKHGESLEIAARLPAEANHHRGWLGGGHGGVFRLHLPRRGCGRPQPEAPGGSTALEAAEGHGKWRLTLRHHVLHAPCCTCAMRRGGRSSDHAFVGIPQATCHDMTVLYKHVRHVRHTQRHL